MPPPLALESPQELRATLGRLDTWLRACDFAGYDPYDSLNASRLPAFFRATPRRRQLVVQIGKRSPVNLRPILGVPPHRNSKALALVASAYAQLHRLERDPARESLAGSLLSELEARGTKERGTIAWGYEFDVQTRWAFYPRGTPNIIVTTFVAHAFLDWFELTGDSSLLATATAAVRYLNDELLRANDASYYAYVPKSRVLIHNANVLGCALTSRVARLTGDLGLQSTARRAAESTLQGAAARRPLALRTGTRPGVDRWVPHRLCAGRSLRAGHGGPRRHHSRRSASRLCSVFFDAVRSAGRAALHARFSVSTRYPQRFDGRQRAVPAGRGRCGSPAFSAAGLRMDHGQHVGLPGVLLLPAQSSLHQSGPVREVEPGSHVPGAQLSPLRRGGRCLAGVAGWAPRWPRRVGGAFLHLL